MTDLEALRAHFDEAIAGERRCIASRSPWGPADEHMSSYLIEALLALDCRIRRLEEAKETGT